MNGSDKQIEWANQIISDFVNKCETVKTAMTARIEKYNARAIKTGNDFSERIADTTAEMVVVDQAITVAKSATNANMIIDLRHILEKPTETTEWDSFLLSSIKLILKEGKI